VERQEAQEKFGALLKRHVFIKHWLTCIIAKHIM
jgi:hypothetical protein